MNFEELKELTKKGELEYAPIPPSGRGNGKMRLKLKDILPKLKPFSVRKPVAFIVGSLAVHGESDNDIDIVVRGEDWSPEQKMAFDFRIFRMFADILKVPYDEVPKYVHIHYTNTGPFTPYVPIYEDTMMPIQDTRVIQMGKTRPMHMSGPIKILSKADEGRRIIAGYASVAEIDKEGDIIPISALKEGIKTLLSDPHYANIMLTHNNVQIGRIIPEYNGVKTQVDDKGLFIVAEIRKDLKIADEVWQKILDGEYNGFSIAGEILESHQECDENKCVKVIDKINIFEVSVCKLPMNEKSGFVILSKCCEMLENSGENMGEEKIENTEEKTEEAEETIEMKVEALERRVEALEKIVQEITNQEKAEEEEGEEEESEEEEKAEEIEKQGLIGAITAVLKEIYEDVPKKVREKLDTVLTMLQNLRRGGYPYPYPTRYPYPTQYPYPGKSEIEEMREELKAIKSAIEELKDIKVALKAKEDAIKGLEERVAKIERIEKEPSTVIEKAEEEAEESEEPEVIIKGGEVRLADL